MCVRFRSLEQVPALLSHRLHQQSASKICPRAHKQHHGSVTRPCRRSTLTRPQSTRGSLAGVPTLPGRASQQWRPVRGWDRWRRARCGRAGRRAFSAALDWLLLRSQAPQALPEALPAFEKYFESWKNGFLIVTRAVRLAASQPGSSWRRLSELDHRR